MYRVIYNEQSDFYTVYLLDSYTNKEHIVFESKDFKRLSDYISFTLGILRSEIKSAFDYSKQMCHNVVEFGFNKSFTISYRLLN